MHSESWHGSYFEVRLIIKIRPPSQYRLAPRRNLWNNRGMEDWEVIVIGGGAAGLMAASRAAQRGRRTLLLEKKKRPGAKILMSGGSRCNLTHALDVRGFVEAFGDPGAVSPFGLGRPGTRSTRRSDRSRGRCHQGRAERKDLPRQRSGRRCSGSLAGTAPPKWLHAGGRRARAVDHALFGRPADRHFQADACGRRPSSSRPEGNRIPAAVRRATATVGRPSLGTRSFRRGPPWCRSLPTPRGSRGCKASRCRMSACG